MYKVLIIVLETVTDFIPSISLEPAMHTVGQQQAVVCSANLIPGEDVNNSLVFTWMAPDGVSINDERLIIMPTVINGSNHTSILQFDYLMENDVGTYKCDIASSQSTFTLLVNLRDLLSKCMITSMYICYLCTEYTCMYTYY